MEKEWLDTLPTIDSKEVTYIEFVQAGNDLADELRNEVDFLCSFAGCFHHTKNILPNFRVVK